MPCYGVTIVLGIPFGGVCSNHTGVDLTFYFIDRPFFCPFAPMRQPWTFMLALLHDLLFYSVTRSNGAGSQALRGREVVGLFQYGQQP